MPTITTSVATHFIPEIWARRALEVMRPYMVLARLVTRDVDYEPGWVGKTLNIPYPGRFTAADKAPDTAAALQTPTGGTTKSVTLNKHKTVDFLIEDVAQAQANVNLLDRYVRPAALALAEAVEKDIWALYASLSTAVGTGGTDLSAATIRQALLALNENLVPANPRYLVISPKDQVALLADSTLQTYFAFSNRDAIEQGAIGQLYGFTVFMSQLAPVVAGTPTVTHNLAFHPEAFILAMRPLPDAPAGSGTVSASIVDPDTGIAIRSQISYDPAFRGVRVSLDVLYGVAVLRPEFAVDVRS
jgi:hypothetical protein